MSRATAISSHPSVSACFPAYNEEKTIAAVIEEAAEVLEAGGIDYEILVCNDASTDSTGEIIAVLAERLPRMRVITHARTSDCRARSRSSIARSRRSSCS